MFCNPFIWIVWATIFTVYAVLLLSPVGDATALFHVASNAFNGRHTESPVWMRYQFPEGCYQNDYGTHKDTPTKAYKHFMDEENWTPSNCATIDTVTSAKKCGPACAERAAALGGRRELVS